MLILFCSNYLLEHFFTTSNRSPLLFSSQLPPIPLRLHRRRHLAKARNIAPSHQTRKLPLRRLHILLRRLQPILEAVLHNLLQLPIHLLRRPRHALRILRHFQSRDGDTAGVGGFAGSVPDGVALFGAAVVFEDVDGFGGAAHVASLGDELSASVDERFCLVARDLVLCRARESDIDFAAVGPGPGALDVLEFVLVGIGRGELGQLFAVDFQLGDVGDVFGGDSLLGGGDDGAFAVGEGNNGCSKLNGFQGGVLGDVAGARYGDAFAFEGLFSARGVLNHVLDVLG